MALVNLSLREIARQIGVSAPALLHHFGDKETLLREASAQPAPKRELAQLDQAFDDASASAKRWRGSGPAQSTPGERRCQAAASEIQSVVQNDPARFPSYHQHLSRPWIAAMNGALERSGAP
jgi:AcrR family transcriptional regulator